MNDNDKQTFDAQVEVRDNAWPCAVIMLIICITFLSVCFAGVYWLTNLPQ